jgi:hypothetical protein
VVSARQDKFKPMALLLKVIGAAGLRAGDTNGKSDPYCRIFVEQVPACELLHVLAMLASPRVCDSHTGCGRARPDASRTLRAGGGRIGACPRNINALGNAEPHLG